jgi:hypothetical protein
VPALVLTSNFCKHYLYQWVLYLLLASPQIELFSLVLAVIVVTMKFMDVELFMKFWSLINNCRNTKESVIKHVCNSVYQEFIELKRNPKLTFHFILFMWFSLNMPLITSVRCTGTPFMYPIFKDLWSHLVYVNVLWGNNIFMLVVA